MFRTTFLKCTVSSAAFALAAGNAYAQTVEQAAAPDETVQLAEAAQEGQGDDDRVVVTGSRVATGEDAPTPVMQLSIEDINVSATTNIAESLGQMPVFANSPGSSRTGFGIAGGNFLNMRSLGSNRTLVLLDGRRFVTTASPGSGQTSVNVDSIPQGLVKRVDTVTGGASAAYGSDAVAGVVNFVLDTEFEGLKGEVVAGQTFRDDGFNWKAQVSGGASFADGRGHVLINAEHAQSDGIQGEHSGERKPPRPWMDSVSAIVANPLASQPGQPAYITLENARFPYYTFEGMVRSGPLLGTGFNPDGSTKPYNLGSPVAGVWASGGDGWNPAAAYDLAAQYDRSALFGRVSYDVTDNMNVYMEGLFSTVETESHIGHGYADAISPGGLPITLDYAYLPADLRQDMIDNGLTTLRIGKGFESIVQGLESTTTRVVLGADGDFGNGWDWSTYYQYGQNKGAIQFENVQNSIAFRNALDAVVGPNGIVCRSTLTNPYDGCVPYNIFGDRGDGTGNGFTQAEHDYLFPTARYANSNRQHVFEAQVTGTAFENWAGDVNVAFGGGYRKEELTRGTNQIAGLRNPYTGVIGAYAYANQPAIEGEFDLWELFGEAQVPLLADQPFIESLDLNLAARYTDYSTSGSVETWKVGLVYVPFDGLRFRSTVSRDVRAANIVELFSPSSTGFGTVRDPQLNNATFSVVPISSGNANLKPEAADTFTAGVVYRPFFLPDLVLSADYYSILIDDQIGTETAQRTVDLCAQGLQSYCNLIARDGGGFITSVQTPYLNLASRKTSGLDLEASYNMPLDLFGVSGDLSFRTFATYVAKLQTITPNAAPLELAGQLRYATGGVPHWTVNSNVQYQTGPWNFALVQHYVQGGAYENALRAIRNAPADEFPGQTWYDLSVKHQIGNFELFGTIQNLFDKDPPKLLIQGHSNPGTNVFLYETQGRRFVLGARVAM